MKRFLSALVVGAVLLSTGLALAVEPPPSAAKPSAMKVKKTYKARSTTAKATAKTMAKPKPAGTTAPVHKAPF